MLERLYGVVLGVTFGRGELGGSVGARAATNATDAATATKKE